METPRQRFLRNHDENIRIMKAVERKSRMAGDVAYADFCVKIIEAWEGIGDKAKEQEQSQ